MFVFAMPACTARRTSTDAPARSGGNAEQPFDNAALAELPRHASLLQVVDGDIDEVARTDPRAGTSVRRSSHRLFDKRWLRSPPARFDLVGLVNRLDRAGVNLQSVRWPSTVRPDLGGHAEYVLRALLPRARSDSRPRLSKTRSTRRACAAVRHCSRSSSSGFPLRRICPPSMTPPSFYPMSSARSVCYAPMQPRREPCRDDYICAGSGACIPPYFVFQMRVDGHPVPTLRERRDAHAGSVWKVAPKTYSQ